VSGSNIESLVIVPVNRLSYREPAGLISVKSRNSTWQYSYVPTAVTPKKVAANQESARTAARKTPFRKKNK